MGTIPDENDARRVDRSDRGEAPASGGSGAGSRDCVPAVRAALDDLLAARLPKRIPEAGCEGEALPLVRTVNRLVGFMEELGLFVLPLSSGELSAPMPSPDNSMAAPFKELHARLSELTWQAQQIARGDYSQRVDFMGDFSAGLQRAWWSSCAEREQSLKAEIDGRAQAEEELCSASATCWSPAPWSPSAGTSTTRARCSTCRPTSPSSATAPRSSSAAAAPTPASSTRTTSPGSSRTATRTRRSGLDDVDAGVPAVDATARRAGSATTRTPCATARAPWSLRGLHHRHHRPEARRDGAASPRGAAAHAVAHRRPHRPLQPARPVRARRAHDAQRAPAQAGSA